MQGRGGARVIHAWWDSFPNSFFLKPFEAIPASQAKAQINLHVISYVKHKDKMFSWDKICFANRRGH